MKNYLFIFNVLGWDRKFLYLKEIDACDGKFFTWQEIPLCDIIPSRDYSNDPTHNKGKLGLAKA